MAQPIRLQKFFTDCGILSRRAAESEIAAGNVRVNGCVAQVGDKIDPDVDVVEYGGRRIEPRAEQKHLYIMLHKPRGYVTTSKDEKGRHTVLELLQDVGARVYPVGRLDMDSEGLLLLTDDGEFANRLTHPRHVIPKIYRVKVSPVPTAEQLLALSKPMTLDGYRLQPVKVQRRAADELEMTLFEGRTRQIRRMCEAVGLRVVRLRRIAIGKVRLNPLPLGAWRYLTAREVAYLSSEKSEKTN